MSRFQGTLLPSNLEDKKTETETRKAVLDLLKKLNEVYAELLPVSGSNDNGSFVKFFDGTMICYALLAAGTSAQTWTYPAPFVSPPVVSGSITDTTVSLAYVKFDAPTASTVVTRGYEFSGGTMINSTQDRTALAHGRWK